MKNLYYDYSTLYDNEFRQGRMSFEHRITKHDIITSEAVVILNYHGVSCTTEDIIDIAHVSTNTWYVSVNVKNKTHVIAITLKSVR